MDENHIHGVVLRQVMKLCNVERDVVGRRMSWPNSNFFFGHQYAEPMPM